MRITESRLRRVIRQILAEVSNITSYDELKEEHGYEVESLINRIANRIYNEQTSKNAKDLEIEYKKMCLDAGLGLFADEIIDDAHARYRDPY
tara:strand:+ start:381 stop:656 length:276 start_codon:yes stop_codon:yes gene_type:complete